MDGNNILLSEDYASASGLSQKFNLASEVKYKDSSNCAEMARV